MRAGYPFASRQRAGMALRRASPNQEERFMARLQRLEFITRNLVPSITIPLFASLVFLAFLVTGFHQYFPFLSSARTDNTLHLPIYVSISILLLILQVRISLDRSLRHTIYLLASASAALAYVGYLLVTAENAQIINNAALYEIAEAAAVGIFIYGVVKRGWKARQNRMVSSQSGVHEIPTPEQASERLRDFAGDAAGLGVLFYVTWGLLGLLTSPSFAQDLQFCSPAQPSCIIVNKTLPGFLPATTARGFSLTNVNMILAVIMTVVVLLSLGFAALLAVNTPTPGDVDDRSKEEGFLLALLKTIGKASEHVLGTLRDVLNPVVWLIPSICIALLTIIAEQSLITGGSPQCRQENQSNLFLALFSPVGPCSTLIDYAVDLLGAAAIVIALGSVIAAVAVAEHNRATIAHTRDILVQFGRALMLALVFFIYALGAVNAVVVLIARITSNLPKIPAALVPFHIGAAGIMALAASALIIIIAAVRDKIRSIWNRLTTWWGR
jgi:hypothetical protein